MANEDVTVLEADGVTQTTVTILGVGRQAAAASKSVAASTEDKAVLDAIAASVAGATPAGTNAIGKVKVTNDAGTVIDPVAAGSAAMAASVPVTIATDDTQTTAVKARISPRFVTVSMTCATDAQDAGDVICATQAVAACTPANDVCGVLHSACLIDTDDVGVNIKMVVFSANTALGAEDSAPDIDDTEALTVLGIVDFAAADYVDLGGSKYNSKTNIGMIVTPATGTDDIYIALYSPTGGTWSSGVITLRLGFL